MTYRSANRIAMSCFLVWVLALSTGCVSQLGYVPGYVKSSNDGAAPSYKEVREWAITVRNGYDTRMTLNRYSGYYGATLAAAAAGAVTGLAAFSAGSSAIIGIPIGTAFLGGVAGVFQNEDMAKVYGYAARYLNGVIVISDRRIDKRIADLSNPTGALTQAREGRAAAQKALRRAETRLKILRTQASADLAAVNAETDADVKKTLQERVAAMQSLLDDAEKAVQDGEANVRVTERRLTQSEARSTEPPRAPHIAEHDARKEEAVCLQLDVNAVMAKVEELLHPLAPNASRALKAVRAPGSTVAATDAKTDAKTREEPPVLKQPDLALPAQSVCDDYVAS